MNKRKFFGTIIGLIFWSICIVFFTYAYYDWKSESTNVVLGIEDLSVECIVGADVEVSNIGPVLDYKNGVITEFSINNGMAESMTIELYLDITSISDNLLVDSLKYAIVSKSVDSSTYDYTNPIKEGTFINFNIGNNLITQDLEVMANTITNYQFIIYIDGNMYNNPNMQENSIIANLMIGNCDGSSIPYDELVYQAIYSDTDKSLTFVHTNPLAVGDIYNGKAVTAVYTGFETTTYYYENSVPWYSVRENIEVVSFDEVVKPKSTAYWFCKFSNLKDIDLEKLDTSQVTTMLAMFSGCSGLTSLNLSNFNTTSVTNMNNMFWRCSSLTNLNLSNFDTSSVKNMDNLFWECSSLTSLDTSSFNTSNVTSMLFTFYNCSSLVSLDLSNFDTSSVTNMSHMFFGCKSLISLNVNNWNTSNVTNMQNMFYCCKSLTSLDLGNWNTSNVTIMNPFFNNVSNNDHGMFSACSSLVSLDISNFDISKITSISRMFHNCSSLTSLDLSSFNTSNVIEMMYVFAGCSSLISLNLSNFNTTSVTNMNSMFLRCSSLTNLNLSNFDTSSVTYMNNMFQNCSNLTSLDLSGFDTSKVTSMQSMFYNCSKLTTSITIINVGTTSYGIMLYNAATAKDSNGNYIGQITINYVPDESTTEVNESTESLVDAMIATGGGNIVKGCYGDYCPVET